MNGKAKCKILKQIRRDIAAKNDIAMTISDCKYQGDCTGTCPKCEAEVAQLEKALEERRAKGLKVALAGISAGLFAASTVACASPNASGAGESVTPGLKNQEIVETLQGDMPTAGVPVYEETPDISGDMPLDGEPLYEETLAPVPTKGILPVPDELINGNYVLTGDVAIPDECCPESDSETQQIEETSEPSAQKDE